MPNPKYPARSPGRGPRLRHGSQPQPNQAGGRLLYMGLLAQFLPLPKPGGQPKRGGGPSPGGGSSRNYKEIGGRERMR